MARQMVAEGKQFWIPVPMPLMIFDMGTMEEAAPPIKRISAQVLLAHDHAELEDVVLRTMRFLSALNELLTECPFCKDKPSEIILFGNPVNFKHQSDCPLMQALAEHAAVMNPDTIVTVPNEFRGWDGPNFDSADT